MRIALHLPAIAIMLTQSWRLTVIALVSMPLYLWIARRSARRLETGLSAYYEMWENVSARIQDGLAAIKTVKLSGAEPREEKRFQATSNASYENYVQRARLGNRYFFWQVVLNHFSKAVVFGYGGWMVLEHQLTPGDVVMFVAYLDRWFAQLARGNEEEANGEQDDDETCEGEDDREEVEQ